MRIVPANPPNFDKIVEVFPLARRSGTIFTYGDTLYNPGAVELSPWLVAHEEIHSLRQGLYPGEWWARYLADAKFRFDEEVLAHRVEWKVWSNRGFHNRHDRRMRMKIIAGRLSGPLYGSMISFDRAKEIILEESVAA